MKSSYHKGGAKALAVALSLAQFSVCSLLPSVAADNQVFIGGIPVIASSQATKIQHNLDNSLVAANNHGPGSVKITYVKGLPVITLGGYLITTVDNATAKAARTTPTLLAQKWANSLRSALANKSSTEAYIAQLSGQSTGSVSDSQIASSGSNLAPSTAPTYDTSSSANALASASSSASSSPSIGWQSMSPASQPNDAALSSYSPSSYGAPGAYQPSRPYQGRVTYIPSGMVIPAKLMTSLSTMAARPGDIIMAKTTQDINLQDGVIPANSTLVGQVTQASGGSRLAKSASLGIKFTTLRTPNGMDTPITAHINGGIGKYDDHSGEVFRGENGMSKLKRSLVATAIGTGTGTALGVAFGAIAAGGRGAGRGAWSGAAIGAGLGLAESLLVRKGHEVNMPQGEDLKLQLDAPVSLAMN